MWMPERAQILLHKCARVLEALELPDMTTQDCETINKIMVSQSVQLVSLGASEAIHFSELRYWSGNKAEQQG